MPLFRIGFAKGMAGLLFVFLPFMIHAEQPTTLSELRNRSRVLLVFAPDSEAAWMRKQLTSMRDHAAEAADRDLVTVAIPAQGKLETQTKLTDADAKEARRRFGVPTGTFTVILVGKDGGEKLRSRTPIPFERLRIAIDSMPMRREERKARGR